MLSLHKGSSNSSTEILNTTSSTAGAGAMSAGYYVVKELTATGFHEEDPQKKLVVMNDDRIHQTLAT